MCSDSQPWISVVQYFFENKDLLHTTGEGQRLTIKALWWQLPNLCISRRIPCSSCVQHLVVSWQESFSSFVWKPSSSTEYFVILCKKSWLCRWPLERRDLHSRFNCLFRLRVEEVGDIVEVRSQRILEFLKRDN